MSNNQSLEFNAVMDSIYASFMKQKKAVESKHDREIRDPQIIFSIAEELSLIPPSKNIIRITGSKGKGTVARMIAHALRESSDADVGLFVSPEEIDHNDRMRVNGEAASKEEFINFFWKIKDTLAKYEKQLVGHQYLSPFGIFLLIALRYFKDKGVKYYVLECGRGVEFDEVGKIPSAISVVTSILLEHPASIGPTIQDIAKNKLFIASNSNITICDSDVAKWIKRENTIKNKKVAVVEVDNNNNNSDMPGWVETDKALSYKAVELFLNKPLPKNINLDNKSAAFGVIGSGKNLYYYDACISEKSIDKPFISNLIDKKSPIFIASLPDDKDVVGIRNYFKEEKKVPYFEIALSGTRGYLHYDKAKKEGRVIDEIGYQDPDKLAKIVLKLKKEKGCDTVYFLGTQTYIRLVKNACKLIC